MLKITDMLIFGFSRIIRKYYYSLVTYKIALQCPHELDNQDYFANEHIMVSRISTYISYIVLK